MGALLFGGVVIGCSFWSKQSFPYLDGGFLAGFTVPNYIITMTVGVVIAAVVWLKPRKQDEVFI